MINKLADVKRLEPFQFINEIDRLARLYPAYTHDDVFYLEADFALGLLWKDAEEAAFQRRREKVQRDLYEKNK